MAWMAPAALLQAQSTSTLPSLPPASVVISNHVQAIGGREAWAKHSSIHAQGKWDVPGMGLSGPFHIYRAKPNKFLLRAEAPGAESEIG
jgi:hypothetical protein